MCGLVCVAHFRPCRIGQLGRVDDAIAARVELRQQVLPSLVTGRPACPAAAGREEEEEEEEKGRRRRRRARGQRSASDITVHTVCHNSFEFPRSTRRRTTSRKTRNESLPASGTVQSSHRAGKMCDRWRRLSSECSEETSAIQDMHCQLSSLPTIRQSFEMGLPCVGKNPRGAECRDGRARPLTHMRGSRPSFSSTTNGYTGLLGVIFLGRRIGVLSEGHNASRIQRPKCNAFELVAAPARDQVQRSAPYEQRVNEGRPIPSAKEARTPLGRRDARVELFRGSRRQARTLSTDFYRLCVRVLYSRQRPTSKIHFGHFNSRRLELKHNVFSNG